MIPPRDAAVELDRADPLGAWRDEFVVADPTVVYLDGNSLGMTPKRTVAAVRRVVEEQWAGDLITSWWRHGWLDLPLTVGDELAPLLGAGPGEVAVHDSTTVCLFQLVNVAEDTPRGTSLRAESRVTADVYDANSANNLDSHVVEVPEFNAVPLATGASLLFMGMGLGALVRRRRSR